MSYEIGDLTAQAPRTLGKALLYGRRALALRCPTCGVTPLFPSWKKVGNLSDWFSPSDGCPSCGYAFEREPGYFLLAIWGVNYGVVALGGMALYFALRLWTEWSPLLIFLFNGLTCADPEHSFSAARKVFFSGDGSFLRSPCSTQK